MNLDEEQSAQTVTNSLLVSVVDAARILSLSRSTVYELMYSGKLPSVKIGGSRRIRVMDLEAFVDEWPDA
jgi:excisionase family DNA binding protein